ncbi:16S rRNA (cytidine(1402)-2'-O)-methyltransferase [Salipaludibacillus sp. LMS25]|jgi:16S rRNA (cytidine1402-2'-O)-methyltransferase|uniref:16S rRNA (cytidine(1402)-2'-O)-methyltransferase n=1 Tax=Salipaludibacillus sp. LMS25 TaxID=2924031 RepID=UPI0020D1A838|nr:16S rRNA (cytidine(1402)-2'-O)-methyltransferase [Salipaludibacillus sp. LMS25]UTR16635.1 16S rRNA (cytidine(1402)-2'-O)-methyltransferase [Salipaludibacillus sp. LMS25]
MNEQRSFIRDNDQQEGALYLVPTPIGNLQDMTFRAVDILKQAHIIAAEDTRHSKKLCHKFEIDTPLLSYHEHNKREREDELVRRVKGGEMVALVSDAGMPAISDPGADLVHRFKQEQLRVIALPGANAAVTALVTSGLPTDNFTFIGFLDRHKKQRKVQLEKWVTTPSTLIFYEAPHRLKDMMSAVYEVMGNRRVVLCRELTKQYETIINGTMEQVRHHLDNTEIKGECVIVIEGASEEERAMAVEAPWWENMTLISHVEAYIEKDGDNSKEAIKKVAKDRQISKREVYQAYHVEEKD